VATCVGGLPDLIANGETGLLVPPRNAEELSGAVLRLLHNPETARNMSRKASAMARERFSVRRLITDMDHLYMRLLEEKAIRFPATLHVHARG
jgi:glycosyltransferase involved in cell wall biosynthesis